MGMKSRRRRRPFRCARHDSNVRPFAPEANALSPELRARDRGECIGAAYRPAIVTWKKTWAARGEVSAVATTVRPARAEFGGVYVQSLIETAERRVADHRARRRRLRAWWAGRRVEELRAYEAWRSLPAGGQPSPPRAAFLVAAGALVCAVAGASL